MDAELAYFLRSAGVQDGQVCRAKLRQDEDHILEGTGCVAVLQGSLGAGEVSQQFMAAVRIHEIGVCVERDPSGGCKNLSWFTRSPELMAYPNVLIVKGQITQFSSDSTFMLAQLPEPVACVIVVDLLGSRDGLVSWWQLLPIQHEQPGIYVVPQLFA